MTAQTILAKLQSTEEFSERFNFEVLDGVVLFTANDYGDLPIWMTADESTTTFKSTLIMVDDVEDTDQFNQFLLRSMASAEVALSSFGIEETDEGDAYVIIGTLSTDSKPEVILTEMNTLAVNAIDLTSNVLA